MALDSQFAALRRSDGAAVAWRISKSAISYPEALAVMEARAAKIASGAALELVWLLEHPPLYTAGTRAQSGDLLSPGRFPVFRSGRGGQYTYHGPGQRVAYVMLDLRRRRKDVRAYVAALQAWIVDTLAAFTVSGVTRAGRIGVWVVRPDKPSVTGEPAEDKISAIGVRVKRWVTLHGISLNVEPDLAHFEGIVPCGVREHGVTSLADLGRTATMPEVDMALRAAFERHFGATVESAARPSTLAIPSLSVSRLGDDLLEPSC